MRSVFKVLFLILLVPAALFLWILQLFLFAGIFSLCYAFKKQGKDAAGKHLADHARNTSDTSNRTFVVMS